MSRFEKIAGILADQYVQMQELKLAGDDKLPSANWMAGLGAGTTAAATELGVGKHGLHHLLEQKGWIRLATLQKRIAAIAKMKADIATVPELAQQLTPKLNQLTSGVPSVLARAGRAGRLGLGVGLAGSILLPSAVSLAKNLLTKTES